MAICIGVLLLFSLYDELILPRRKGPTRLRGRCAVGTRSTA
nr:PTS system mannose-specific EIID component [Candidatus Pantoea persica]